MSRLAIVLLLSMQIPSVCRADTPEWTGFMGANRDGWVSHFRPPTAWPEQLGQRWQTAVGAGYGSPLVIGDRVYQHARQADSEVLLCLSLSDGDVIWQREYRLPFKMGGGGEQHGKGPKSSPVYSDGRVFTLSITGLLIAWDADSGKQLWSKDYASRFKTSHPYWGVATSPIVDGDRIFVHFGNDDEGILVALDVATGNQHWANIKDAPSYSSPLVAELDGIRQLIEWNHRALVGVDLNSGRQLWEFPFPHESHNQNMPTPAIYRGQVLIGGENRGIHSVQPQRDGQFWTVKERWHQDKLALDMSSAVINGDALYGFSHYDRGRLFCLDAQTGEIHWTGPPRTGENVAFLSVPGHIVALLNDGVLKVIAGNVQRLDTIRSYEVSQDRTWAPPVLLQDGILIKDDKYLTYWSLR